MSGYVSESFYCTPPIPKNKIEKKEKKRKKERERDNGPFFHVQKQAESPESFSVFHVILVAKETFLHLCSVKHLKNFCTDGWHYRSVSENSADN